MMVEAGEQRESSASPADDEEELLLLLLLVHPSRLHHIQPSLSAERQRRPLMSDPRAHRPQAIVASILGAGWVVGSSVRFCYGL